MLSYPIFIKAQKLNSALQRFEPADFKAKELFIYDTSSNRYRDTKTGRYIAVGSSQLGKITLLFLKEDGLAGKMQAQ